MDSSGNLKKVSRNLYLLIDQRTQEIVQLRETLSSTDSSKDQEIQLEITLREEIIKSLQNALEIYNSR